MPTHTEPTRRRALAVAAVAGVGLAAMLGLATDQASAAYTARVQAGTLHITGDAASDTLELVPEPLPGPLHVLVNGTEAFTFDRSTFTSLDVQAGAGDDTVTITNAGSGKLQNAIIDGGPGDDTLRGGDGDETFVGGSWQ